MLVWGSSSEEHFNNSPSSTLSRRRRDVAGIDRGIFQGPQANVCHLGQLLRQSRFRYPWKSSSLFIRGVAVYMSVTFLGILLMSVIFTVLVKGSEIGKTCYMQTTHSGYVRSFLEFFNLVDLVDRDL